MDLVDRLRGEGDEWTFRIPGPEEGDAAIELDLEFDSKSPDRDGVGDEYCMSTPTGTQKEGLRFPGLPADEQLDAVARALAELAPDYDRTADFPVASMEHVQRAGILTSTVGSRYGGPGGNLTDTLRILRTLGRGDPSVALILLVHPRPACRPGSARNLAGSALCRSARGIRAADDAAQWVAR